MVAEATAAGGWGTWEELILGGAVLKHGTNDWNDVASELRARTVYPCSFTPQACKDRYEQLQKRYSGSSNSWFEELRKQRVADLKRQLAKYEDSIGSLESKIKSLKSQKKHSGQPDCASNNDNSAGSFTKDAEDTRPTTSWSCENRDSKDSCVKILAESNYGHLVVMRKRRGQRSRKDCNNRAVKERSVCESDHLSTVKKGGSTGNDCGRVVRESSGGNDHCEESCPVKKDGLIGMFKAVAESESAAVFRHRMDSQKRARYRGVIKQHVDIGTIRSRIIEQSIKSAKELFRDLLLLANNALVFYSRRTHEYKSALAFRHLVMQELKKHCRGSYHESASAFIPCSPPVRPRTARPRPLPQPPPRQDKVSEKALVPPEDVCVSVEPEGLDKISRLDDSVLQNNRSKGRKGLKRPGKLKHGLIDTENRIDCVVKQRKRVRR